ncbi:MAG: hypothetical protein HOL28_11840 [Crocinitomicaceae bacterium]|jgi:uncharacterized protein (UPF0248 family)|nr:hypothetical protein [Crocinitomicaceae bacterium]MBT5404129.1 hypothetical protein [Crocinitomicaceae bacterium]MBT6513450.1 hypothetical protein [Crocinitomicaceae bacterium]
MKTESQIIEKEDISSLNFPSYSLNKTPEEKRELKRKLRNAQILGNIHHNKIRIIFRDETDTREVRTTVWAAGEKHIVLKGGVSIPIRRVVDIRL